MTTALTLELQGARRLRAEARARQEEFATIARAFEAFLRQAVSSIRGGRPTFGLTEEAENHLNDYKAAAVCFLDAIDMVMVERNALLSKVEEMIALSEPLFDSINALRARVDHALASRDRSEVETFREELKLLRSRLETHESEFTARWIIDEELNSVGDLVYQFRATNASVSGRTALNELKKLVAPPALATFILATLSKPSLRHGMVGDAEEDFHKNLDEHGRYWAAYLYWVDTIWSVSPLLWRLIVRKVATYLMFSGR